MTASPRMRSTRWVTLVGLYLFAVGVNLIGITWGLPGQGRDLLPALTERAVVEEADQAWATAQDPARHLNLGPPAADRPETVAKVLRRFALYTADPDEVVVLMAVARLNPLAGRWDPGFANYGSVFFYTLGGGLKLASLFGFVTLRSDPSFYMLHPERIARIYLVGRLMVVLVGAMAIPVLWLIARALYGERIALLAAGLAGCIPGWVAWSHVMKPWAFGAPFALAAVAVGQRLPESHRPWPGSIWAGSLTGLAAATAPPFPLLLLLGPWTGIALRRQDSWGRRLALAAAAGGGAGLMALALHPYWFTSPWQTIIAWRSISGWYPAAYHPAALAAFAWGSLGPALGFVPVVIGATEGILLLWRHRETLPVLAPLFLILVTAAVRTGGIPGDGLHARLVLPAVLLLSMLAVGGLCRAAQAMPRPAGALLAVFLLPSLLISAALLRNFIAAGGPESTRQRAGAWINALPRGTSIGIIAPLAPFRSPFFRLDQYRLVIESDPRQAGPLAPEYFLVAERAEFPAAPAFLARYREVQRFAPPGFLLGEAAMAVYPFAVPSIVIYGRRAMQGCEPTHRGEERTRCLRSRQPVRLPGPVESSGDG